MTTDGGGLSLDRTSCADVPLLRSAAVNYPSVDVLGIELQRSGYEQSPPATGVAAVAHAALSALSTLPDAESRRLILVAASWPARPPNRLGVALAMRNGLWTQWQNEGVVLPRGARQDFPLVRSDDKVRFAGWIDCGLEDLGAAVEVTRSRPALCVLHPKPWSEEWRRLIDETLRGLGDRDSDGGDLLRGFIPAVQQGGMIVRGFGGFDDRRVGVDIYAHATTIDAIEDALMSGRSR